MSPEQIIEWRKWNSERWEAVEQFKARELAAMTEERALQIIDSLESFVPISVNPLNGLGLVEQQDIFHRRRS